MLQVNKLCVSAMSKKTDICHMDYINPLPYKVIKTATIRYMSQQCRFHEIFKVKQKFYIVSDPRTINSSTGH